MSAEPPSRRCELTETVDLERVFAEREIEHLDVDECRTFVLYQAAIMNLRVTEGTLTDARGITVEYVEVSRRGADPEPGTILTEFCETLPIHDMERA